MCEPSIAEASRAPRNGVGKDPFFPNACLNLTLSERSELGRLIKTNNNKNKQLPSVARGASPLSWFQQNNRPVDDCSSQRGALTFSWHMMQINCCPADELVCPREKVHFSHLRVPNPKLLVSKINDLYRKRDQKLCS